MQGNAIVDSFGGFARDQREDRLNPRPKMPFPSPELYASCSFWKTPSTGREVDGKGKGKRSGKLMLRKGFAHSLDGASPFWQRDVAGRYFTGHGLFRGCNSTDLISVPRFLPVQSGFFVETRQNQQRIVRKVCTQSVFQSNLPQISTFFFSVAATFVMVSG